MALAHSPMVPTFLQREVPLAPLTTLGVGGPAAFLGRVGCLEQLQECWWWASRNRLPVAFLGEGSNVLVSDAGFPGVVLLNGFQGRELQGRELLVMGGENLGELIRWTNQRGLGGMERMYGIPGSVAGALVGNAGAYGQEIAQVVVEVQVWRRGERLTLTPAQVRFRYRHSLFKEDRDLFLLGCLLRLRPTRRNLQEVSDTILERRLGKYPVGLRCPGSFFKNVPVEDLSPAVRERVPADFVQYGKIPAGKLLEVVGANGQRLGDAQIASYHGNLFINRGKARSSEILTLALRYARKVWERFGIWLEPEIYLLGEEWPSPPEKGPF